MIIIKSITTTNCTNITISITIITITMITISTITNFTGPYMGVSLCSPTTITKVMFSITFVITIIPTITWVSVSVPPAATSSPELPSTEKA